MKISRKSFVYRMAYDGSVDAPRTVSVCGLFWRFLFTLLVLYPCTLILSVFIGILWTICTIVSYFRCFFMATHGNNFFKTDSYEPYKPYKHWPTILGHRVWPITVLGIAYFIFLLVEFPKDFLVSAVLLFGLVTLAALVIFFINGIPAIRKSDAFKLAKAYIKAKKERVCPLIRVTD